jgi:DNA-binding NtrC family response regulator
MYGTEVLVVSAHPQHCKPLVLALNKLNLKTAVAFSAEEALESLSASDIPVVCTCAELRDGDYRLLLDAIRSKGWKSRLLVITQKDECPEYLDAMEHGVFDFLPAPFQQTEIERIVRNALAASSSSFPSRSIAKTA